MCFVRRFAQRGALAAPRGLATDGGDPRPAVPRAAARGCAAAAAMGTAASALRPKKPRQPAKLSEGAVDESSPYVHPEPTDEGAGNTAALLLTLAGRQGSTHEDVPEPYEADAPMHSFSTATQKQLLRHMAEKIEPQLNESMRARSRSLTTELEKDVMVGLKTFDERHLVYTARDAAAQNPGERRHSRPARQATL